MKKRLFSSANSALKFSQLKYFSIYICISLRVLYVANVSVNVTTLNLCKIFKSFASACFIVVLLTECIIDFQEVCCKAFLFEVRRHLPCVCKLAVKFYNYPVLLLYCLHQNLRC